MGKELAKRDEVVKPIKIYWIYRKDGWFLGGGPCPVGKEKLAEKHLEWCQDRDPDAYLEWMPGTYTYAESYVVCRNMAEAIQREQPGIREAWSSMEMSMAIAKVADLGEVAQVRVARKQDADERKQLGTHDQKTLDAHRAGQRRIDRGIGFLK